MIRIAGSSNRPAAFPVEFDLRRGGDHRLVANLFNAPTVARPLDEGDALTGVGERRAFLPGDDRLSHGDVAAQLATRTASTPRSRSPTQYDRVKESLHRRSDSSSDRTAQAFAAGASTQTVSDILRIAREPSSLRRERWPRRSCAGSDLDTTPGPGDNRGDFGGMASRVPSRLTPRHPPAVPPPGPQARQPWPGPRRRLPPADRPRAC